VINLEDKKKKLNPRLDYRFPQEVKDEFIKICKEQALDPGRLIENFMKGIIEKYKPQE
jgi:antitoxin component of RelBE/YafQ-DinJ toxin-antitoxin module